MKLTLSLARHGWLLGTLGGLVAACGAQSPEPGPSHMSVADPAPVASVPRRVVSQTILSDEVLWDMGPEVRSRVVGVSVLADDTRYAAHPNRWPADTPRLRTSGEEIMALSPDLAILASFTGAETRALIDASGIQILVLEGFEGFESFREHVRLIGNAVGAPSVARDVVAAFDLRLVSLRVTPARRPTIVSYNGGMVPARGTTFDDEAMAAGFINAPTAHGLAGHAQVSVEQVAAWDPDYLVVPCGDDCAAATALAAALHGLSASRAVHDGHVIGVPSPALFSTGAGMLDVVQQLSTARETP